LTIEYPSSSEDVTWFYTDKDLSITKFNAVVVGSASPAVEYTVRFTGSRNSVGTEAVISGSMVNSVVGGDIVTGFDNTGIVSGSWVWLETTQTSGTVQVFNLTMELE
jgi:hypothetical protein